MFFFQVFEKTVLEKKSFKKYAKNDVFFSKMVTNDYFFARGVVSFESSGFVETF